MKPRDWLSERMVFGTLGLICTTIIATLILTGYATAKGVSDTMQGVIMTGFLAIVTLTFQSVFRTDRVDRINAETAHMQAANAASPQPVAVVNPPSQPVPVTTENA